MRGAREREPRRMHPEAARYLVELALEPHPEGGYFRETHRSPVRVAAAFGERSALTSILFLLTGEDFSAFHALRSDEAWHFYRGCGIALELLRDGVHERRTLGPEGPWQTVVPAGVHFAAAATQRDGYALVGCDVGPGFDFVDFTLDEREELTARFPRYAALIERFTRARPRS